MLIYTVPNLIYLDMVMNIIIFFTYIMSLARVISQYISMIVIGIFYSTSLTLRPL